MKVPSPNCPADGESGTRKWFVKFFVPHWDALRNVLKRFVSGPLIVATLGRRISFQNELRFHQGSLETFPWNLDQCMDCDVDETRLNVEEHWTSVCNRLNTRVCVTARSHQRVARDF